MLYDPEGQGRYGIRSPVLLGGRRLGTRFPIPALLDQELYLLRKSRAKGRTQRIHEILSSLEEGGKTAAARERTEQLFSAEVAAEVIGEIDRVRPRRAIRPWRHLANAGRLIGRIFRPIGYWVELVGTGQEPVAAASELAKRLEVWLVRVDSGSRPVGRLANLGWWLGVVTPIRLRPAVYISSTVESRPRPAPDLALVVGADPDVADLAKSIVAGMASRALR
jgi:hypothetical protein